jgi:phosphoglycolate phosphatase
MLYLFDIDGTLVHCHGAGRRAFERACHALLGPGSLQGIRLDGKTDPLILEEAFAACAARAPTAEEAGAIERAYEALLHEETAAPSSVAKLPFVDEVLAHLGGRGAVLGLATGNWRRGAQVKLGRVGLWERFCLGGFGCDARDRGELVRVARRRGEERLGRPARREEVLVIGDTPRDIEAAHAAGATAIGVATGAYGREALAAAGADAVYADLGAFLAACR